MKTNRKQIATRSLSALVALLATMSGAGCATKYTVRTYPAGAQVYTRDLNSNEKKLVGVSPVEIAGEATRDVFFLVVEKQNYKPKKFGARLRGGDPIHQRQTRSDDP